MFGTQFYPTPPSLRAKMHARVNWDDVRIVLDPLAGRGDLLDDLPPRPRDRPYETWAIEIDGDLRSVLRGKGHRVIDSDFLNYAGGEHPDVILMNPPFFNGADHLLRAIDIAFCCQVVCTLNAETIRNPYTRRRAELVEKLNSLGAEIEYMEEEFANADRKTSVEVALISFTVDRSRDLKLERERMTVAEMEYYDMARIENEVALKGDVEAIVARYDAAKAAAIDLIVLYAKRRHLIGDYFELCTNNEARWAVRDLKTTTNRVLAAMRVDYWRSVLDMKSVRKHCTTASVEHFEKELQTFGAMEFSRSNVHEFIRQVAASYSGVIADAIEDVFDKLTREHAYHPETKRNSLHYSTWVTNHPVKVNNKVIVPVGVFSNTMGRFEVPQGGFLVDIDKVCSYFAGNGAYISILEAMEEAFQNGQTRKIESTFFFIDCYMKGTVHLHFRDLDVLRRFNVYVGKRRQWLPDDYAQRQYKDMSAQSKAAVDAFEGERAYQVTDSLCPAVEGRGLALMEQTA